MPAKKPDLDEEILRTLVLIWQTIGRTNQILRKTERHNKKRHKELLAVLKPVKPGVGLIFQFGLPELKERNDMPAETTITNEQKVSVTLNITTDSGKPAKVDGAPAWVVLTGNSTVTVADDGLSAVVVSADDPGDTSVLVKADANLGEGIEEISDTFTVHVVGATAKNLGLTIGTPEPK